MKDINLIKVHNNWKENVLGIDIILGNYCNYKCWYCFPHANEGTHKFPDINLMKKNLSHLINYYKAHSNKTIFDIQFSGGEPTHWKEFPQLIKFLKENFNCLISMTSNGSKKLDWWKENARCFDRIHMSCHHEFVKLDEFRDLCDYLYKSNVVVSVSAMMDPQAWDKCIENVEYLKKSRYKWTIRYVELIGHNIKYTEEQKKIIAKHRARKVNFWFFLKNNKYYKSSVTAVDDKNKKYKFADNGILLNRLNNFYGWECSLGVNWINISMYGTISGTCGQFLYGKEFFYNLYDEGFDKIFNPTIRPMVCKNTSCTCTLETVMPKRKIHKQMIIPIYEN